MLDESSSCISNITASVRQYSHRKLLMTVTVISRVIAAATGRH
jgi:hypothetical protein